MLLKSASSVGRTPRARGHSVHPSPNAFGLLLFVSSLSEEDEPRERAQWDIVVAELVHWSLLVSRL